MTPGEASNDIESTAAPLAAASLSRTPLLRRRGVRAGILACAAITALTGTVVVAYELALARVPEHRAALERLVRAQTGLDLRFNELGLRWGWYGPEAVFRGVELGEPGRSNVLLRAPQLVVGFDAWRTMQTGQLAAGRITLVAPDIDLERLTHSEPPSQSTIPARGAVNTALASRVRILERWRGGQIDLEGGTLKLPDPGGSSNPLTVQVRRASLRHSDREWSGFGLVFLPERLGRAARVVVQLKGDLSTPATLSGGVRFEGMRLAYAGWREVLSATPWIARSLPATGDGDMTLDLTLADGRIQKANGQVKATDVTFGTPAWIDSPRANYAAHGVLKLDYLAGEWRFVSRKDGGQVQVEQLALSRAEKNSPLPRMLLEFDDGHMHGSLQRAPLHSVAAVAQWLAPQLVPTGIVLKGDAENLDFDWNAARVPGERLAASARVDDASVASTSGSFALSGLRSRLTGSESRVAIELAAPAARLQLQSMMPDDALESLQLNSVLEIVRNDTGWRLSTERFSAAHESGHVILSGSLSATDSGVPVLEARGTIPRADIAKLRKIFAQQATRAFGPAAARLTGGRIEEGRFELNGPLDEVFAAPELAGGTATLGAPIRNSDAFKGSLTLRGAHVAGDGEWPEMHALDATIDWSGSRVHASVDEGRADAFELDAVQAQWDMSGVRPSHVAGRARAPLERALAWVRAHPQMQEHAPHLQDLVARGDALFDFDVSIPGRSALAPRGTPPQARTHIAAFLEGVEFRVAPDVPPIEALRGSLAFDSGRLQRSTLSALWLGGPLTLKVSERRDRAGSSILVQTQGFADTRKLVALTDLHELPQVNGETQWGGEFLYTAGSDTQPARWQGHADSNLIGISSTLPVPFAKLSEATLPLRVEVTGSGDVSEVRVNLADRIRSQFALSLREGRDWQIESGNADIAIGNRMRLNASLQTNAGTAGTDVRVESQTLGVITGTLVSRASDLTLRDVKWARDTLAGEGSIHCGATFTACDAKFEVTTDSAARALADLGFRADLAASKGKLSGQLAWQPRVDQPWLETATGHINMQFEDGIARSDVSAPGHPFPLLAVPALLRGIDSAPNPEGMPSGELRFKRLVAEFDVRDGQAHTSDLHFDGDAEILMRGRTGLLARDYDYEAWVLRGQDRIPVSLRRLAATPRLAAAWMALRDLISSESAERSHVVLNLRGSWSDPVVTVD